MMITQYDKIVKEGDILVLQGIDVLVKDDFKILKNRKIGLITNYSFVDRNMKLGIDLMLESGVKIVKIFTPEHGFFQLPDAQEFEDTFHPVYNLPLISLFGKRKKPTSEDLEGLDLLVYDIQDVGLRYYTFIYTLAYCMEAASENGIEFLILDRVNPLGGYVFGPRMPEDMSSFVGGYALPLRYGLTPGELGLYFKKFKKLNLDLKVVKLQGWRRDMSFDETGLFWNTPSPGLPTYESTICYSGTCLFEGTNISEGRGTTKPFQFIGAPWMKNHSVYGELKKENWKGFMFRKREFVPMFGKYTGQVCWGIEFLPISSDTNFFTVTFKMLQISSVIHEELEINEWFDTLMGDKRVSEILKNGEFPGDIMEEWKKEEEDFMNFVDDLLLYQGKLKHLPR